MEILLITRRIRAYSSAVLIGVFVVAFFPISTHARTTIAKPPNNLGLVGYWPMNEGTTTSAGDYSGNGNTGSLQAFSSPPTSTSGWTSAGRMGSALTFDGSDDKVDAGSGASLNLTGQYTLSAWVYNTSQVDFSTIMGKENGTLNSYYMYLGNGSNFAGCGLNQGASEVLSLTALRQNQWYHVVCVHDATSQKVYINGALDNTGGDATNPTAVATSLAFGKTNAAGSSYFNGKIDEIRIYNRALTASEVAFLYSNGTSGAARVNASSKTLTQGTTLQSGLVGLWSFDGGDLRWTSASAASVIDGSGTNNPGVITTMSRATSTAIGKLGQGLRFDGIDDKVEIDAAANDVQTGNFSVSLWFKPGKTYNAANAAQERLFEVGDAASHNDILIDMDDGLVNTAGHVTFGIGSGAFYESITSTASTWTAGTWYHVVATYSTTAGSVLYINNIVNGTDPSTTRGSPNATTAAIGRDPGDFLDPFNGVIDEVRLYNRALSASEAAQLYNLGSTTIR